MSSVQALRTLPTTWTTHDSSASMCVSKSCPEQEYKLTQAVYCYYRNPKVSFRACHDSSGLCLLWWKLFHQYMGTNDLLGNCTGEIIPAFRREILSSKRKTWTPSITLSGEIWHEIYGIPDFWKSAPVYSSLLSSTVSDWHLRWLCVWEAKQKRKL